MKRIIPILVVCLLFLSGCNVYMFADSETKELLGTYITITAYDYNQSNVEVAVSAAFAEISRIENLLSIYMEDTEIYSLNENGFLNNADPELTRLIVTSNYYSRLSDGAFDITVQPILDLYTTSFEDKKRAPTKEEVSETLKLVGYKDIIIDDGDIRLRKDMEITLGGIAKGYAIDRAIAVLQEHGITNALVNAGGDIRTIGKKKGKLFWNIALRNPDNSHDSIISMMVADASLATSGNYERYFDPNKQFHHIINPKTGYSANELISVTVMASTALEADALATTVFVLGPEKGLNLVESLKNVEALVITNDREIIKSSGFEY